MKTHTLSTATLIMCAAVLALAFFAFCMTSCELVPPDLLENPAPHSNPDDPEYVNPDAATGLVVVLTGAPTSAYSCASSLSITVGGTGVTGYKYSFDDGEYSADTEISTPITLSALTETAHTLKVLGKNSTGAFQDEADATVRQWTSDFTAPAASPDISAFPAAYVSSGSVYVEATDTAEAENIVVFRYDPAAEYTPTAGTAYTVGAWPTDDCEVVYQGTASGFAGFTDPDVPEGLWVYRAYAHDAALNYGTAGTPRELASYRGAVYVRFDGDDANAGTIDDPLMHISAGVTVAVNRIGPTVDQPAEIRVAGDSSQTEIYGPATAGAAVVTLNANIHVLGGYNPADWSVRNEETYRTILDGGDGKTAIYNTVYFNGATGARLDGLEIRGSDTVGNFLTYAVCAMGSTDIEITRCYILGGDTTGTNDAGSSYGIYLSSSSADIHDNHSITGGGGYNTYGIGASASSVKEISISGNVITGGSPRSNTVATAVYMEDDMEGVITGNTIRGADTSYTGHSYGRGVWLVNAGSFTIAANHIFSLQALSVSVGIVAESCSPVTVINNHINVSSNGTMAMCVNTEGSTSSTIRNNTLITETPSTGNSYGLILGGLTADDSVLVDNNIFHGVDTTATSTAFYSPNLATSDLTGGFSFRNNNFNEDGWDNLFKDQAVDFADTTQINENVAGASGNQAESLTLNFDTGHVTSNLTGVSFDTLGLDGAAQTPAWDFTTDISGATRTGNGTIGWSMGCFEYD